MGRTEQAEYFRQNFVDSLVIQGTGVEDMTSFARRFEDDKKIQSIFLRWDSLGRELFFVKRVGFVNIHVRADPPGFWGITKQVISDFDTITKQLNIPCWFVLLVGQRGGSDVNGYIVSDIFMPPMIKPPSEQTEAFKINERNLDSNMLISNTKNVARSLIEFGESKFPGGSKTIIRRKKR